MRLEMERMAAEEAGEAGEEGEEEEEEGEEQRDLDEDVPDLDEGVPEGEGAEWSDDDEDDDDDDDMLSGEEENETGEAGLGHAAGGERGRMGMGVGMGIMDGPATPVDDRTPQRFRLNPFQAPMGEGDGDYGSPLAARHSQRAAAARARDVSPGVRAAMERRGQGGGVAVMGTEMDTGDAMEETMIEGGSYEHTDTEAEDLSSEEEGTGPTAGLGGRSVFGGGALSAAVRRISGQRRVSGERRVSGGERRVSGGRRASGRRGGLGGREN